MRRSAIGFVLLVGTACGDSSPKSLDYDPHPEPPIILRDVALIDDDVAFTRPYVPGHRTTMDGRIAIRVQGGPPGTQDLAENLSFYLLAPERLAEPIMTGPAGAQILADATPYDVPFPPALDPDTSRLGHHAICDPTEEFPVEGEQPNPQPCGPGGAHDCYEITIINSTSKGFGLQLWGTPARIEVAAPKTAEAYIVSVELGEPVAGAEISGSLEWTEPAVTIDGRLLTGRLGLFPREWTNPRTGETLLRNYDLAYSVLPPDAAPCDVTRWTDFHPMSYAPYDPEMEGRYGLAAYPFRDTEGNLIHEGEDLGGTYPWVDRKGANVFMTGVPGRIAEQSEMRYPRRCVVDGCESFAETYDWDRGFMVAGLWTHGKFVHLDAMINNVDWAVGVTPAAHYLVDLYRDASGAPVEVRFGSGRFIDAVRYAGGPYPPGYTHNANILDSLENVLNHSAAVRAVTPRDIVWIMSTGVATDEIVFDDFVDANAFIVSNMQASITQLYDDQGGSLSVPHHHNGQVRRLQVPLAFALVYVLQPDLDDEIHVQNAATSLRWNVPAYGLVEAGTARVEPVALGGIHGRGFWLSGENEIRYAVGAQPRPVGESDWYVGLFLDPRYDAKEARIVASFPDGSVIRLVGRDLVEYVLDDHIVHSVVLPQDEGWMHLGWTLRDGNRDVTLLHDGFALDRYSSDVPLFELVEGDLVIGRAAPDASGDRGFRGWIDELKVFAYAPNAEVACNHASGTLVELDDGASEHPSLAAADGYPSWGHDEVAVAAGRPAGRRFACFRDYTRDYGAHLGNIPAGAASVRKAITFPEGPIRAGVPRPDSSENAFCQTCHHAEGRGGLALHALDYEASLNAEDDYRRQPLQPPRRVFGNIPPGWIPPGPGLGSPESATQAPPEGLLIDLWVLPAVE
jgi:hypothetical protein